MATPACLQHTRCTLLPHKLRPCEMTAYCALNARSCCHAVLVVSLQLAPQHKGLEAWSIGCQRSVRLLQLSCLAAAKAATPNLYVCCKLMHSVDMQTHSLSICQCDKRTPEDVDVRHAASPAC